MRYLQSRLCASCRGTDHIIIYIYSFAHIFLTSPPFRSVFSFLFFSAWRTHFEAFFRSSLSNVQETIIVLLKKADLKLDVHIRKKLPRYKLSHNSHTDIADVTLGWVSGVSGEKREAGNQKGIERRERNLLSLPPPPHLLSSNPQGRPA